MHARKLAQRLLPADKWTGIIAVEAAAVWYQRACYAANWASAMWIPSAFRL